MDLAIAAGLPEWRLPHLTMADVFRRIESHARARRERFRQQITVAYIGGLVARAVYGRPPALERFLGSTDERSPQERLAQAAADHEAILQHAGEAAVA